MNGFNLNDLSNNQKIIGGIAIVVAIVLLFCPLISISIMGQSDSANFFDALGDFGIDTLGILVSICAAFATVYFVIQKNAQYLFFATLAGVAGLVLFFISGLSQVSDLNEMAKGYIEFSIFDILGFGFWVGLIGHGVNVFLVYKFKDQL